MSSAIRKNTGSFYTESKIAETMVKWAIRSHNDRLLEPSFGDGIFLNKSLENFKDLGKNDPQITAIEIQPDVVEDVKKILPIDNLDIIISDYLAQKLALKYDVVIGNPPYIGIRKLSDKQFAAARNIINEYELKCPNNGSVWFPFVLHSINALDDDGRIAFVLPFEITYARYSYGLWEILTENFAELTICRIFEDFFPNVDVETVILYASGKGGKSRYINYNVYNSVADYSIGKTIKKDIIAAKDIYYNRKPFISSILSNEHQQMIVDLKKNKILTPIIESCKFKIGYVSADKEYFHPTAEIIKEYSLPEKNFCKTILNSKEINGCTGIGLEVNKNDCSSNLCLPIEISNEDNRYIEYGKSINVHQRYKCKRRSPWYITPLVEQPDVILSVFGDIPKLVINKGKYAVTNSLLCGNLNGTSAEQLICRWYNSLTLLSLELNVHSLGGGSFVIIPGEADKLMIVNEIPEEKTADVYFRLNEAAKTKGTEAAYSLGDKIVLQDIFGLTDDDLKKIQTAITQLKKWRKPVSRRSKIY